MHQDQRKLPHRKSIRLKGWDYRNPGLYFVTMCTKNRAHHFGKIREGVMGLSVPGCIAWHFWRQIPNHHANVILDEFVVMPNHLHGIVGIESLEENVGTLHATSVRNEDESRDIMSDISPKAGSLSVVLRSYKSVVTRWCRKNNHQDFGWQSRFYDHIIRNEKALGRIRDYIFNNPVKWQQDLENIDQVHEQAVEYMINV